MGQRPRKYVSGYGSIRGILPFTLGYYYPATPSYAQGKRDNTSENKPQVMGELGRYPVYPGLTFRALDFKLT